MRLSFSAAVIASLFTAGLGPRPTPSAGREPPAPPAPCTRTYYIAADPVSWNYMPTGRDEIEGKPYTDTAFFASGKPRPVSTTYRKVLYREYTDSTFRALKPRPPEWEHLGFLGPVIRGVVGDTIRVVFRNNGSRPYSVHPHGVFYEKSSEGAPYDDGAGAGRAGNGVPPGTTFTYVWSVPPRAGPGPMDGSSVMWMYHSHVDEVRDINTGLLGAMIITAREKARADGSPSDVDRELVATFAQVHEEDSWLAKDNLPIADMAEEKPIPNRSEVQAGYPWFVKFTINGYIHGGLPIAAYTVKRGQRVRWYLMTSTNDFDVHSPHWHGNSVTIGGMRTDVAQLSFMGMAIANMTPDNVGTWLFHCHVSFHNAAGMAARYRVVP